MNNIEVSKVLTACRDELRSIASLLEGLGEAAKPAPYLRRYAVIRATGSVEVAFKTIIADKVDHGSHDQVKSFIRRKIRESSYNPRLGMIETLLSEFDDRWRSRFDELMALDDKPRLKGSLTSLVEARNKFAHGGSPDLPMAEVAQCFEDATRVLEILDTVVHEDYSEA